MPEPAEFPEGVRDAMTMMALDPDLTDAGALLTPADVMRCVAAVLEGMTEELATAHPDTPVTVGWVSTMLATAAAAYREVAGGG